jgi:hypothetical protein
MRERTVEWNILSEKDLAISGDVGKQSKGRESEQRCVST